MNKDTFREMADQMKPSDQLVSGLHERLDQMDQAMALRPETPAGSKAKLIQLGSWRFRATAFLAAAACLAVAFGAGAWVAGLTPGTGQPETLAVGAATASPKAPEADATPRDQTRVVVAAEDYAEVYQTVQTNLEKSGHPQWLRGRGAADFFAAEDAAGTDRLDMVAPQAAISSAYTATNTQVAGIDEGDIVKTDGHALYVASGSQVSILLPKGASTSEVANIDTTPADATIPGAVLDMMLYGQTLVVFIQEYEGDIAAIGGNESLVYVPYTVTQTKALLYDVTDPAEPTLITSLGQSGAYNTSRLTGGVLYLVTEYELTDPSEVVEDLPETYVPQTWDGDLVKPVSPREISIIEPTERVRYTVASAIDLATNERLSTQTVLMGADTVYMGPDNLYLAATRWGQAYTEEQRDALGIGGLFDNSDVFGLVRLSLGDGHLKVEAEATAPGRLLNQFSLDEMDGYLRLVVDVSGNQFPGDNWLQQTSLLVLDSDLNIVGSVPQLVTDESVKSVRFTGEVGYVVTFRQTDPLFAVDLSDPANPVVMSELKIPGFSAYLHPWPGDQLLGIGVDADDDGRQQGLKLAMFDVADPYAVDEVTSQPVRGDGSEALNDHKAVLVDTERGLVGFPVWAYGNGSQFKRSYAVYSYGAEAGFKQLGMLPIKNSPDGSPVACFDSWGQDGCGWSVTEGGAFTRGVLVGEYLYVITAWQADVYALDSLDQVASVTLG